MNFYQNIVHVFMPTSKSNLGGIISSEGIHPDSWGTQCVLTPQWGFQPSETWFLLFPYRQTSHTETTSLSLSAALYLVNVWKGYFHLAVGRDPVQAAPTQCLVTSTR
jgi:hypothetical protein